MDVIFAARQDKQPQKWAAALQQILPSIRVHPWESSSATGTAQVAIVWEPPADLFEREPNLKYLFNLGAGVDALLRMPGLSPDAVIVRVEDAGMADQMAEYALYYLLRESRGFGTYDEQQRQSRWHSLGATHREQWPVGVMGAGRIGARVAALFAGLNYPVAVWSRSGRGVAGAQSYGGESSLGEFLRRTRVLINVLPLTAETQGILCRRIFEQLQPDAYLINMARGGHLVESDLLAALESGRLRGAALDVVEHEPLPAGHPFWTHPRIRITPHISGITLMDQTVQQIAGKIQALDRGETISGVVDRAQQY